MFGVDALVNRLLEAVYRRGQALAGTADRATDERRMALRDVRQAMTDATTHAEYDREHGAEDRRELAIAAANRANAIVQEVSDDEARQLVAGWKAQWDAIPKGSKAGSFVGIDGNERYPAGLSRAGLERATGCGSTCA